MDMLTGARDGRFYYFENTGNSSAPAFASAVDDLFSAKTLGGYSTPTFEDLDGDGDFDMIAGSNIGSYYYFENTGSATIPSFSTPAINTLGFSDAGDLSSPAFADLDNDGDLDMLSGESYGNFLYFENTGSASAPAFSLTMVNLFGLKGIVYRASPSFADLDGDGDFDMISGEYEGNFLYFENFGTDYITFLCYSSRKSFRPH